MRALARPPADLTDFPTAHLLPTRRLFRIHLAEHGPWWFSASGQGRFDLTPPMGTCYLAEQGIGAFVEAFQRYGAIIPAQAVQARRISVLSVPSGVLLADCTNARARAFGLTAEIHSMTARNRTQVLARAFAAAGFGGIRFLVRHDPAQQRVGIALFGPAGEATWPVRSTEEIGANLILDVEQKFGIRVQP